MKSCLYLHWGDNSFLAYTFNSTGLFKMPGCENVDLTGFLEWATKLWNYEILAWNYEISWNLTWVMAWNYGRVIGLCTLFTFKKTWFRFTIEEGILLMSEGWYW